ncbi:MarR family winged helix-turn-helix transcriptional regulator [Telmatospirillum siberiense]|nr:MarR family transcriptional regulator [Telmatospirillum siberiense]
MSADLGQMRRDFGLRTIRLGRHWRAIVDGETSCFGLTASSCRPLFHLGKLGDGVRPKDLADALDMEPSSLGELIDRLEEQGLVQRRDAPGDRRCKTLHLTESGQEMYRRIAGVVSSVGEHLTAGISDADLAACLRVFAQIERNVETLSGAGRKA